MRGQGRGEQIYRPMNGMMPNQQMMRMNGGGDLRQAALQNHQANGFRYVDLVFPLGNKPPLCMHPTKKIVLSYPRLTPQMQMAMQQRNAMLQQGMRRDPSGMEVNGARPHTPSSGDHAPSPKRARMDGFNPQQMMQNGRPPPGMPPQMMPENTQAAQQANAMLVTNGINPGRLSQQQFAAFQNQPPNVQQKAISVYSSKQGDGKKA